MSTSPMARLERRSLPVKLWLWRSLLPPEGRETMESSGARPSSSEEAQDACGASELRNKWI